MKDAERLARFVKEARFEDLSSSNVEKIKILILDSLGCALGALGHPTVEKLRQQTSEFGGNPLCSLIGDGLTSPDRAAFFNSALVRYLDFNDSFLAPGETCHPSDNLGSVLAAGEYADISGREFLVALALAYEVQCRLSQKAPVRAKGFDHVTQGTYGVAAGVSKALNLDATKTANAIGIAGTAFNALRVTRTGDLSHWKGLAYANMAFGVTHGVFLAKRGITGPSEVFEGNKGFKDAIAGPFEIDWERRSFDLLQDVIIKKFNAEIHSQSCLEGIMELRNKPGFNAQNIKHVGVEIFDVAFNIIGGGEEGGKKTIRTKEEADHSLPYMISVALLDGQVMPRQYEQSRIRKADVQDLLQKVTIKPSQEFSKQFPGKMKARITLEFKDGRTETLEKDDFEGFHTRPARWDTILEKYKTLAKMSLEDTNESQLDRVADTVRNLEQVPVRELASLLRNLNEVGYERKSEQRHGIPVHPH